MQALEKARDVYRHAHAANVDCVNGGLRTRTKYTYDGMGNVQDDKAGLLYGYDDGGRLNSVWQTATTTGLITLYNGMGELARSRRSFWDPCSNAEILQAQEFFAFAPDGRALHLRTENYVRLETDWVWLDGEPVAQFEDSYDALGVYVGTNVTYLHSDHLGTPRVGTDQARQVTWRYKSDAFGNGTPTGTSIVRLRLPGQITLGLGTVNYNYLRDYYPKWGRYGDLNSYTYVDSSPVGYTDRLGLFRIYGRWCGPDWTGGRVEQFASGNSVLYRPPTDKYDNACRDHDVCYSICRDGAPCNKVARRSCMIRCDRQLADAWLPAMFRSRFSGGPRGLVPAGLIFVMLTSPEDLSGKDNPKCYSCATPTP
jgi:RHS protein